MNSKKSIMLGEISVRELHGPQMDFLMKLQGNESREWLEGFKKFLRKENPWEEKNKSIEHIIDCDTAPFNPWEKDGWTVNEHKKGGQWKFDPKKIELYLASSQKSGRVEGNQLRKELSKAKKLVFNANVLDYIIANPHLIPEEWKKDAAGNTQYIFFWGTIYRDREGGQYVRCLYWDGGGWHWGSGWLDRGWSSSDPAAVRA